VVQQRFPRLDFQSPTAARGLAHGAASSTLAPAPRAAAGQPEGRGVKILFSLITSIGCVAGYWLLYTIDWRIALGVFLVASTDAAIQRILFPVKVPNDPVNLYADKLRLGLRLLMVMQSALCDHIEEGENRAAAKAKDGDDHPTD
jgi:hypothetical protein